MRKLLRLVLVVALPLCLAIAVFAQEITVLPTEASGNIQAIFDPGTNNVTHAYSVTITWSQSGTLTYHAANGSYTWDPSNLKYILDGNVDKSWTVDNAKVMITVTNRSDVPVQAVCNLPVPNNKMAIIGEYDQNVLNIPSAAQDLVGYTGTGTAQSLTATYSITLVSGEISTSGPSGQITVNLAKGSGS